MVEIQRDYYENGQIKGEYYYLGDNYHREDGPAVQEWFDNGIKNYDEYYLNGELIIDQDYIVKVRQLKLNKINGK